MRSGREADATHDAGGRLPFPPYLPLFSENGDYKRKAATAPSALFFTLAEHFEV